MALRIRENGQILCAAHTDPLPGDTYLHDGIHYFLSVLTGAIVASDNHSEDNLWFWNIQDDCKQHYAEILENKDRLLEVKPSIGKIIHSLQKRTHGAD